MACFCQYYPLCSIIFYPFTEALALIKTVRLKGSESITHDHLADYHMGDYYLSIVPYNMMNDQNEEIDRGTYVPQHSFSVKCTHISDIVDMGHNHQSCGTYFFL